MLTEGQLNMLLSEMVPNLAGALKCIHTRDGPEVVFSANFIHTIAYVLKLPQILFALNIYINIIKWGESRVGIQLSICNFLYIKSYIVGIS